MLALFSDLPLRDFIAIVASNCLALRPDVYVLADATSEM